MENKKHLVLCLAGRRGLRFLEHVIDKHGGQFEISVFTCNESDENEPRFTKDIFDLAWNKCSKARVFNRIQDDVVFWEQNAVDILMAVGWRYLIPKETYSKARLGAYVFHDSLLPRYRGFAPTVRAMINGEYETGVSLIEMVEGVDKGDIIGQTPVIIDFEDTIKTLMDRVTDNYLEMFDAHIEKIIAGKHTKHKQEFYKPHCIETPSYSPKMMPSDYYINWNWSTEYIDRFIRAVTSPYPGAKTMWSDVSKEVTILKAKPYTGKRYVVQIPGRVVEKLPAEKGHLIMTGDGLLFVHMDDVNVLLQTNITLGS